MAVLMSGLAWADETSTSLDASFRGPGAIDDRTPQRRIQLVTVFVGVPAWYWGWGGFPFSVGARFYQPVLHDGFLPTVNDSFGIEVGGDLIGVGTRPFVAQLSIPAEAMWQFHFTPQLSAYLKLGLALELRFGNWCWNGGGCGGGVGAGPIANIGVAVKLTQALWLRVEAGYPGLRLGLSFPVK